MKNKEINWNYSSFSFFYKVSKNKRRVKIIYISFVNINHKIFDKYLFDVFAVHSKNLEALLENFEDN